MNFLRSIVAGLALTLLTCGGAFAQCGTTAPANKFCGNDTGSSALATWKTVPTGALSPIPGGTVLGNRGTATVSPTPVTNPVLGIPGTSTGEVGLAGATSGTAVLRAQAAAGSAVSLLPTAAGTLVGTASSPLAINSATGLITCPTCVTSSGGGAITGTAPISVSAAGVVSINAPYTTLSASNGGIVYSGSTNLAILAGTATARQMLQSGATAAPAWSTATWPATTAAGSILVSASINTVTATAAPVLGVAGSTVGSIGFQNATSGTVTLQPVTGALGTPTINIPAAAGTMAVSATSPVTLSAAGAIACATCVTSSGGGAITGTSPIVVSAAGAVSLQGASGTLAQGSGGTGSAFTATPTLGVAGSLLGTMAFANLTSGSITLSPPTGALGSVTLTLPALTDTLVSRTSTDTFTNKTYNAQGTGNVFQLDSVTVTGKAAASDYFAGTSTAKLISPSVIYQSPTTTTFGSTTTFDFSTFNDTAVTLTGNITTMTLSNVIAGKSGTIAFVQDGTGSRTTVWNSIFKFAGGVAPTLSTAPSAIDILSYTCRVSAFCVASLLKDVK